ncbi:MAG TPA: hypothetical protein VKS78_05765 [Roseiarcus sp.]|nr:hypothetical protein [Roseiarcus sp.]
MFRYLGLRDRPINAFFSVRLVEAASPIDKCWTPTGNDPAGGPHAST